MRTSSDVCLRIATSILLALSAAPAWAQNVENFTGSLQIVNGQGTYSGTSGGSGSGSNNGGSGSTAVQAQCPANFPVSCTAISEPY